MTTSHPEPMGADRKVLVIGLIAMIVFVVIGVGSAHVFTASACGAIESTTTTPAESSLRGAGVDGFDPLVRHHLAQAYGDLVAVTDLGSMEGTPTVEAIDSLVDISEGVGWRSPNTPAVIGDPRVEGLRVAALADGGSAVVVTLPDAVEVVALSAEGDIERRASFGQVARVVGDGSTLFVLAHVNDLTGQLDAFVGMDERLVPAGCVDTALVGSPLAFHLSAGGGELVLLRVEENGGSPQVELRDVAGARWRASFNVPVTPPGILAERLTAGMNDQMVVVARRALSGDAAPVITALDRADGTVRWHLAEAEVAAAFDATTPNGGAANLDEAWRARVMSVTDTVAVIAFTGEDTATIRWLEVDLAMGSLASIDVAKALSAPSSPVVNDTAWRVVAVGPWQSVGEASQLVVLLADDGRLVAATMQRRGG